MPITLKTNALNFKDGDTSFASDLLVSSITEIHGFVTPEMYGAVGDGTTDDTAAWQAAVDSGKDVVADSSTYKCGQIEVTKDITIDCRDASFICTGSTLFYAHGSIVRTITGQSTYTANASQYAITSDQYGTYSGFAMLIGTNNFEQTRSYYAGGFVCTFLNGRMNESYPIEVSNGTDNVSIAFIKPITVVIENVGNISYVGSDDSNKNWIRIEYGMDCILRGFKTELSLFYTCISLEKCIRCVCENLTIMGETGTTGTNSYIVAFNDSSFCAIRNSQLFNKYWHCGTTGGTYLCYRNMVDNCVMGNYTGAAYVDHPNGIGTVIRDSVVATIGIGGLGVIDKCIITQSGGGCNVNIFPTTDDGITGATITNSTFMPSTNTALVTIRPNPYVSNLKYYIDKIYVSNVYANNQSATLAIKYDVSGPISSKNAIFVIGRVVVTDADAETDFDITSPNVDRSNEKIVVRTE